MTNKQFRTLVKAIFVAGWIADGETSVTEAAAHAGSAADKFLEKEGFGEDEGGQELAGQPYAKWKCCCGCNNQPKQVDCYSCGKPKTEHLSPS